MIQQNSAQEPKPLHHLLLPTVSQIKTSVGTVATGHEKCIISGCSARPGSLRRLQWRKMLQRDGWALFLEICLNWSQVFDCSVQGYWLQWASYFRLNARLSALGPIGTFARHKLSVPVFCFNLESLASFTGWWETICNQSFVHSSRCATWGRDSVQMFFTALRSAGLSLQNWELVSEKINWPN